MVLRNRCISTFAVLFVSCFLLTTSNAVAAVDAAKFDFNGNGHIDPGKEATAFLRHVSSRVYREVDKNNDGKIQPKERKEYFRGIESDVEDLLDEYNGKRGTRDAMPVTEANRTFGQPMSTPTSFDGVLIREKHEDVTVLKDASQFKSAKGAILSFSRNIAENENTWALRGAILRPVKGPSFKETFLTSYSIVPSISFDRATCKTLIRRRG